MFPENLTVVANGGKSAGIFVLKVRIPGCTAPKCSSSMWGTAFAPRKAGEIIES